MNNGKSTGPLLQWFMYRLAEEKMVPWQPWVGRHFWRFFHGTNFLLARWLGLLSRDLNVEDNVEPCGPISLPSRIVMVRGLSPPFHDVVHGGMVPSGLELENRRYRKHGRRELDTHSSYLICFDNMLLENWFIQRRNGSILALLASENVSSDSSWDVLGWCSSEWTSRVINIRVTRNLRLTFGELHSSLIKPVESL